MMRSTCIASWITAVIWCELLPRQRKNLDSIISRNK